MADADASKLPALDQFAGPMTERVYQVLKAAIMALDFPPGIFIRKRALCERFGLSRTPIADALAKLSTDGLVEITPQSGTRVARLSMAAIREDMFLREALEVAAVRVASASDSKDMILRLNDNVDHQRDLIRAKDAPGFMAADLVFHEIIMETTGFERLKTTVRTVSPSIDRARILLIPDASRRSATLDEHIAITNAVTAHDPETAVSAMRIHIRQLLRRLEPLEDARPDLLST